MKKYIYPLTYNERSCLRCGNALPEDSYKSRRYCPACAEEINLERSRLKTRKRQKEAAEKKIREKEVSDRKYCKPCIYSGRQDGWNLCDYILVEGKRRGCPAGTGCVQKKTKAKINDADKFRVCEICGTRFEGGKYRRLCDACGKERRRQAGRHMNEMRRGKAT